MSIKVIRWKHTKQLIGQGGEDNSHKALANNTCDGDCKQLADKINIAFQSVTKDLPPLDLSILPPLTNIISVETVEKKTIPNYYLQNSWP